MRNQYYSGYEQKEMEIPLLHSGSKKIGKNKG